MFHRSNCLFLFFNLLALISGCVAIASSLYFQTRGITECQQFVQNPLMIMGIVLLLMSLLGLIGTFFRVTWLLWVYSCMAFLVIVGLAALGLFVYMVKNPNDSTITSGVGFKKYNFGDYSQWMSNMVKNRKNWNNVRDCLIERQVCKDINNGVVRNDKSMKDLSPVQSGCCRPPADCGFVYVTATSWRVPNSGPATNDTDCKLWSNGKDTLCYDCNSCKDGVVKMTWIVWRVFTILDLIDIVIVLVVFAISCCTRKNILLDRKFHRGYA